MNRRKSMITAFVVTFLLVGQTPVFSDTLSKQLQNQQNQLKENQNLLKSVEDKREEIEIKIQKLDNQVEELMDSVEEGKKQVTETEKDIEAAIIEVKSMEEKVDEEKELAGKRLRELYKNGTSGYLNIIFKSKGFSDFISRIELVKKMVDYDRNVIKDLEEKKQLLDAKKAELDKKKEGLVALQKSNEQKLATMNDSVKEQKLLIAELDKQQKVYASRVNESEKLVDATIEKIKNIRKSAPKFVLSRGAAPISDNNIIAYASNFLGTPYVWGGTSPDPGFDCSGFTQYVFAHFGIQLGRTTKDQIHDGVAVSKSQLEVGDLVLFGDDGIPSHMGIYAGNNTYIHAPQTGDVVKISLMTRKDFITGRRVK